MELNRRCLIRFHLLVPERLSEASDNPSGEFNANGAWTVLGALAHNLLRWTQLIGLPDTTVRAARTLVVSVEVV